MTKPLTTRGTASYIAGMRYRLAFGLAAALAATPSLAQDDAGKSLMERGAELFFEGLRQEMEPKLEELRGLAERFGPSMSSFLEEMGPAFLDMVDEVKDWTRYYPPEMLPNGDIIIRKRPDPEQDPDAPDTGEDEKKQGETDI